MIKQLVRTVSDARFFDLAHPWFVGMPHHPSHPPYLFSLVKKHGDMMYPNEVSSASEAIALGGHVGTHIDALCHFSCGGVLHDGTPVEGHQSYADGIDTLSVDTIQPIFRRGLLFDIAGLVGQDPLPVDFSVTPEHLDQICARDEMEVEPGDVVLLRTGWAKYFPDPVKFLSQVTGPGPEIDAARWLSSRGVFAAGSDTLLFEKGPNHGMPVHVHLLVESGIHIIECLNLEELAAAKVREFVFVASPLKIQGGTGSPVRPFAIAE